MEKVLTNRGLRRSLTTSIFLHRGQLPSPRGKLRRSKARRSKAQAHRTLYGSSNQGILQGKECDYSLNNHTLRDLGVRFC
ncbi:hypothetical protein SLEP1_g55664 [Rubroshorea leprosula]|uniref:Uncharacterized protein n=1 Tax=Rubroshorea leprosula TaxID=152421 RepID=A0AAV5MGE9_9ROSI|nr:hypothetical protein SLEP1_g55664 [Rubroshorea leprosula]